jgi:putative ABC transport system permease protein
MVTALLTKLARDLLRIKGQAITIGLVVACGIASYVTLQTAYSSLELARDRYYDAQRFADVFAHCKRAPDPVLARIAAIRGVAIAEARLVEPVMLPMPGYALPATGRLVGLPAGREPQLDAPLLREGRMPEPGSADEVAVLETFARAHALPTGATIPVVVNGAIRNLRVVGIVQSPEYVFPLQAGAIVADFGRFAVLWMDRAFVGAAFELDGAFDDIVIRLQPGADERAVMTDLDAILRPYGGLGAVERAHQPSHFIVSNKITQLASYATIGPAVFLGVAAFLVNVVLSRLVILHRPQIATLKALGYTNREIGLHYLELVLVVVVLGAALGVALGAVLGRGMLSMFARYFEFPAYPYRLDARIVATSVAVSLAAGAIGAFASVKRVGALAPAQAMQPEAPPTYRASVLERFGLAHVLSAAARMVLREVTRRPLRLALSLLGIAAGIATIVAARGMGGALDAIVGEQFEWAQREDVAVAFTRPLDARAVLELRHVPGVLASEPLRVVPVRVRRGHRYREVALTGHAEGSDLRRVIEHPARVVPIPDDGVLLTDKLAEILGADVGDFVELEVLEGDRRVRSVRVAGVAREMFGLSAHMALRALHAMLDETAVATDALLMIDAAAEATVDDALKKMPHVAGVTRRRDAVLEFERQAAEYMRTTASVLTIFGCTIAFGVVYNNARVALSMRSRDLASLRVLGFTRAEISAVLLGELTTYVALAIAPGLWLGKLLMTWIVGVNDPELFRMPVVVTPGTYVLATIVTVLAATASALLVRRELDRLDLVGVLKARD